MRTPTRTVSRATSVTVLATALTLSGCSFFGSDDKPKASAPEAPQIGLDLTDAQRAKAPEIIASMTNDAVAVATIIEGRELIDWPVDQKALTDVFDALGFKFVLGTRLTDYAAADLPTVDKNGSIGPSSGEPRYAFCLTGPRGVWLRFDSTTVSVDATALDDGAAAECSLDDAWGETD